MEKYKWKIVFDGEGAHTGHVFIDDLEITNQIKGIELSAHVDKGDLVNLTLFILPDTIEISGMGDNIIKFIKNNKLGS